jgi:uncharacterized YkwD family protein
MKRKVIALTLSAVLALSSTTAFAAECTTQTKVDINSLLKNYNLSANYSQYKLFVNGKEFNLNSIYWAKLFNSNTKTVIKKQTAAKPSTTTAVAKPVQTKPATQPAATKPTTTAPAAKPAAKTPVATKPTTTPAKTTSTTPSNTAVSSSNLTYEQKVVELVNVERQKAGLQALKMDSAITNVAELKSKDMATKNYFAHQSPTYGSAGDMLTQFGIRWSAWGENIASGQRTPEAVVTAWMNSAGHRANILSPNFSRIGVGYVTNSNGTAYWTQIFAN